DEEHRTWFCARYAWYCQQMMQTREMKNIEPGFAHVMPGIVNR
ncbi:hypothetical protein DTL37_27660, partial [Escherichia coli]